MNRIPPINRLRTVLSGYVVAALAGATIPIGGYLVLGHMAYGGGIERVLIPRVGFAFIETVGVSLLPVAIIIALTETFSIRAVFAHVLLGILVFIGCAFFLAPLQAVNVIVLSGMTSAGIVAGLVYWRIAGRNAGCWRDTAGPS